MTAPRSARRRESRRRRRTALAIGTATVLAAIVAVVAVTQLAGDDDAGPSGARPAPSASAVTTAVPGTGAPAVTTGSTSPATTPPPPAAAAPSRYAVGTRTLTFVDASRTTTANGSFPGSPSRTIPTEFWYPASGAAGGEPVADAPPDAAHGPYPLVVFAHGFAVTPDFYAPLLERWATAGYVVAAPVYPILSGSNGGASHVDYEKTFGDTSFVIDQVLALGRGELLAGLVDPKRIAAAGHSDGEVVSFGAGFLECCRDPRVRSVIAMAGDLANANNPHVQASGTPILHIMEVNDEYDPYPHSIQWDRDNLTAPRWLVSLQSSHVPPYTRPGDPAFELVSTITVAFFDGTLRDRPARLDDLTAAVAAQPAVGALER